MCWIQLTRPPFSTFYRRLNYLPQKRTKKEPEPLSQFSTSIFLPGRADNYCLILPPQRIFSVS